MQRDSQRSAEMVVAACAMRGNVETTLNCVDSLMLIQTFSFNFELPTFSLHTASI